jgi:phosphate transport system ATP-binding protein
MVMRDVSQDDLKARVEKLDFWYGAKQALKSVNLDVRKGEVTALIGPSGCGKSTLLRCFNRMHDLYPGNRHTGQIRLLPDDVNLLSPDLDPIWARMRIGMVFQKPNPFPKSILENVVYGLRIRGLKDKRALLEKAEIALRGAALWDEVKDRLGESGLGLSGGQQQRLCIARCLATDPDIILFDEPTSALDPIATVRVEELVKSLRTRATILIVTHNMQQAERVSDSTAFMYLGDMVEHGPTRRVFSSPQERLTQDYLSGAFG